MPDMDGVGQIELAHQFSKIIGVGVHVVALPGLTRTAVAAAVMGDAAITVLGKEEHLVFPGVGRQRPAVTEHDRLTGAPVLKIDLRAVFGGNVWHVRPRAPLRGNWPADQVATRGPLNGLISSDDVFETLQMQLWFGELYPCK